MSQRKSKPLPDFTAEFCYFLGFVWGDGYLYHYKNPESHRIILENKSIDLDLLLPTFQKLYKCSLFRRFRKKLSENEILRVVIYDKLLYSFLIENGYGDKTNPHNIIDVIPQEFQHYFWRGLFDADGCISSYKRKNRNSTDYKAEIASHINQDWSALMKWCSDNGIDYTLNQCKNLTGSASHFIIGRIKSLHSFKDLLYQNYHEDEIGLERKYCKFNQLPKKY